MSKDFEGRVALITGGSGALGSACARRLLAGGAQVALLARDRTGLDEVRGALRSADVRVYPADVTRSGEVDSAVQQIESDFGRVDIVVCAAGTADEPLEITDLTDEGWRTMFATNTDGTFFTIRSVLPGMRRRDYGRIIALASVAGSDGNPHEIAYSASKAAVMTLVRALGKHLATTGIRVHAVAPTVIDSPMGTGPEVPPELVDYLVAQVPVGRPGRPDEVADLVAFLAREQFQLSTGATFDLSGGQA
ncbi:SDR family NAD(P)-dependent oxidoreductase [Nocardioides sp.]|uniref:SDR family NAD(P)-dependent oxidoreductase n=1 Tax=Nocardioides sp. TaxID=35761 RepID=UPI003783C929